MATKSDCRNERYQFKLVKIKGEFVWHKHDVQMIFICGRKMEIEFLMEVLK
ncbi:MAG: hypothetical protein Ct9H300mP21_00500 [Pseudomonadota bacterium]|nr:MAG: hypothetical protein Ct9H300mP21_00500 [Pseudomonadota bacterium]